MNLKSNDVLAPLNRRQQRELFWAKLFEKYEDALDDDSDAEIELKNIVKVYSKIPRKQNVGETHRSADVEKSRKRGRPKRQNKSDAKCDIKPRLIQLEKIMINKTENKRKRGRPRAEDIAKVYGKIARKQNVGEIHRSADMEISRKRGRPKKQNKADDIKPCFVQLEKMINKTENKRKRGRPRAETNTKLKGDDDRKIGKPNANILGGEKVKNLQIKHCLRRFKAENETAFKNELETVKKNRANALSAVSKKNSVGCSNNIYSDIKKKDLATEKQKQETIDEEGIMSLQKRGRRRLDKTRTNTVLSKPEKKRRASYSTYIVYPYCRKEFEKKYPGLLSNDIKFSRKGVAYLCNSDGNSPVKISAESESCTVVSETLSPIKMLENHTEISENLSLAKMSDKSESGTVVSEDLQSTKMPFKNNFDDILKQEQIQDVKENGDVSKKSKDPFTTWHWDSKEKLELTCDAHTRYTIEENLQSDLGYMVFKWYQSKKLVMENKLNSYSFWHAAVRNEVVMLLKMLPKDKLEDYMIWCIKVWTSSADNKIPFGNQTASQLKG